MPDLRLRKEERLQSRKLLASLFTAGQSLTAFPLRFVWTTTTRDGAYPVRIAFSVAQRRWKRAVDRNRYKRRMREAYRHQKDLLYSLPLPNDQQVLIACLYTAHTDCTFDQIQTAMTRGLKKLALRLQQ